MKAPLVSIIIPVYNSGREATAVVWALMEGNYRNLEIILVDDGSEDDSLEICRKIAKKWYKKQVRVFHQENGGASSARNLGMKKAQGELFCFVDSDDLVAPEFVETLVKMMQKSRTALAGTGMLQYAVERERDDSRSGDNVNSSARARNLYVKKLRKKQADESRQDYILWMMLQDGRLYPVANKIFWAKVIRENHLQFNPDLNFAEDLEFVLKYLTCAEGEIRFDLAPLYFYQIDRAAGTVGKAARKWGNWQKSYDFVKKWAGKSTVRTKRLLKLLKLRWMGSYLLAWVRK